MPKVSKTKTPSTTIGGAYLANAQKFGDKSPDFRGKLSLTIPGTAKAGEKWNFSLAGWNKAGKDGDIISIAVQDS